MHELSIAYSLVTTAEEALRGADVERVDVVHLRLGLLAGVVKEALLFSYDVATESTALEGSRLEIEDVPLVVYCPNCASEQTLDSIQLLQCPACGTPTGDIRQGREIELVSLECIEYETPHS